MTRLVACKVLFGKCDFDAISACFLKESGGRKGVPKITFFEFFGTFFCYFFVTFYRNLRIPQGRATFGTLWVRCLLASFCVRLPPLNR